MSKWICSPYTKRYCDSNWRSRRRRAFGLNFPRPIGLYRAYWFGLARSAEPRYTRRESQLACCGVVCRLKRYFVPVAQPTFDFSVAAAENQRAGNAPQWPPRTSAGIRRCSFTRADFLANSLRRISFGSKPLDRSNRRIPPNCPSVTTAQSPTVFRSSL